MAGIQLFANRVAFLTLALLVSPSAAPSCYAQALWGDEGSFPEQIVELVLQRARVTPRSNSADEIQKTATEFTQANDAIQKLVESVEGQKVRSRLSVLSTTAEEVRLLPDVTYGFPTRRPEDVPKDELILPIHSGVTLQETGVATPTKQLVLKVGKDIPESVAKGLQWNDKVVVTFQVDSVELLQDAAIAKADAIWGKYNPAAASQTDGTRTYCTVQVSDLRFVKTDISELIGSHRTWLWPGPGTLPFALSSYAGGDGFGPVGLTGFSDYASLATFRGAAVFQVESNSQGYPLKLYPEPLISKEERGRLLLAPTAPIDERAFDPAQLAALTGDSLVLLHFDATVAPGTGPVQNRHWHGHVIELTNVRVGTPEELAEAERELDRMPELAKQNRLAVQSENILRITEAARREAASANAAAKSESPAIDFAAQMLAAVQGQEQSSVDNKPSSNDKKASTAEKQELNRGVYVGFGIAFVGVLIYLVVFTLDGGPSIARVFGFRR